MNLRKAKLSDAEKIAVVLLECYNMDSLKEAKEAFKREMKMQKTFVLAEETGKVIAVASWQMHDVPKHKLAELHRIAVLSDFRGTGVSTKIFRFMVDDCHLFYTKKGHGLRKLFVLTHDSNQRAQRFYEKLGFKLEARLPNHYYNGEDELVYSMFFEEKDGGLVCPLP